MRGKERHKNGGEREPGGALHRWHGSKAAEWDEVGGDRRTKYFNSNLHSGGC